MENCPTTDYVSTDPGGLHCVATEVGYQQSMQQTPVLWLANIRKTARPSPTSASRRFHPCPTSPKQWLSVLVIGGGVGGLVAASECWRHGCSVRVIERFRHNVTKGECLGFAIGVIADIRNGDSFSIGPTATDAFKNWPSLNARNL